MLQWYDIRADYNTTWTYLVVDILKDWVGAVELEEEHDEDAVVGHLLEVGLAHLVVDEEDAGHDPQYLSWQ